MIKAFEKVTNYVIGVSVLGIVLGIIFILFPWLTLKTIGILCGVCLLLHGIFLVFLDVTLGKVIILFENMFMGILFILLGLILIIYPNYAMIVLTTTIGIWMIVNSISRIRMAMFFKSIKEFPIGVIVLLCILDILLGILVIIYPFEVSMALATYLGCVLIIHSVFKVIDMVVLKKNVHDKEKKVKELVQKAFSKKVVRE